MLSTVIYQVARLSRGRITAILQRGLSLEFLKNNSDAKDVRTTWAYRDRETPLGGY
jgi:hypothetical protein